MPTTYALTSPEHRSTMSYGLDPMGRGEVTLDAFANAPYHIVHMLQFIFDGACIHCIFEALAKDGTAISTRYIFKGIGKERARPPLWPEHGQDHGHHHDQRQRRMRAGAL